LKEIAAARSRLRWATLATAVVVTGFYVTCFALTYQPR